MTLFMPPIQRKKKVDEKYNPDTFRVISEDAVSDHPKFRPLPYRASFEPRTPTPKVVQRNNNAEDCEIPVTMPSLRPLKNTRVLPKVLPDHRAHKPHPKSCGFLDRNVRFLNEPICNVYTAPVQSEEARWWPTRANPGELLIPPYAEDTHYRTDYNCRHGERPGGSGRHTSNTAREPALGAIPVNYLRERDGSQRFYKEGLSYEHMYNCRSDPNYPIRGKRHGAFVWNRMDPISQRKFIEYYERVGEEERRAKEAGIEGPLSPKGTSAPVIRSTNHKGSSGPSSPKRKASTSSSVGKAENQKICNSEGNGAIVSVPSPPAAEPAAPVEVTQAPVSAEPTVQETSQNTNADSPKETTAEKGES